MTKRIVLLFVSLMIFQGCATNVLLTPTCDRTQEVHWQDGIKFIRSEKSNGIVSVGLKSNVVEAGDQGNFIILVYNKSENRAEISEFHIYAYSNEDHLKVWTYRELAEEIERERRNAAIAASLGAIGRSLQASQAGTTYHSGSYNAYHSGSSGSYGHSGNTYGTYQGRSYNPAIAQMAQNEANRQTQQDFNRLKSNYIANINNLEQSALRQTTVSPYSGYGGIVKVSTPEEGNGEKITLKVDFNRDRHVFNFFLIETN